MQCNIKPFRQCHYPPPSLNPHHLHYLIHACISPFFSQEVDRQTDRRLLHPGTDPHLFDLLFILHHQTSGLQDLLQRLHDTLKRRLGAFFLREAGNGDVGAPAAVEEGVEFGGYGERGNVESCE